MLERWTRAVVRRRRLVLAAWLALVAVGVVAGIRLPAQLSNSFAVPGTDSERARVLLERHFRERPDGTFVLVARGHDLDAFRRTLAAAARAVPGARPGEARAEGGLVFGEVQTTLDLAHAKRLTPAVRAAADGALVTGQPAIQHDLDPVLSADLRRGEAFALPLALAALAALFGVSLGIAVPFAFAAATIATTLALVWALAPAVSMVSFVTNFVELVGLGIAVDYALFVVQRHREELREHEVEEALVRTLATAGRAVVFSGGAVAVGLASLIFVPVPLIRSLGIAGMLIPLTAVAATLSFLPALLAVLGRRVGVARPQTDGFWRRIARATMRRPGPVIVAATALLLAAAAPALRLHVSPGSFATLPRSLESARALALLRERVGAGVATPTEVVLPNRPHAAVTRLADRLFHDPEVLIVASGWHPPYVDATGRRARVFVAARHDYGAPQTQALVRRLRSYAPPGAVAGGPPAQGVDFLDRTYAAFRWLVVAVLAVTFLVLLRAFRSLLLPLKAVLLNLLSVGATYGLLELIFRRPIDGWIPVVLFATLFGLSMDYEVFLVSRMREAWERTGDNAEAVATGLERTGRIVTTAAAVMVAAFLGFAVGRVDALRVFGTGLALAVAIDATLVRAVLLPALMAVLGRWNWWLPGRESHQFRGTT